MLMANKLIKDESFKKGGKPLSINKQKTHHGAMQMPNFNLNKYIGHKDGGITKGTAMKKSDMKEDMKMDMAQDKAMIKKAVKMHDTQMHGGKKTDMKALKKGGAMHKMPDGSMMAGKSHGMAKGGCMAKGGGIEIRGKTKGRII